MTWGPIEAIYDYPNANGQLRIRKVRREGKRFYMQSWVPCGDGKSRWLTGINDCRLEWSCRALYNLPVVLTALAFDEPVYLTEGEKDADAVQRWLDQDSGMGVATSHWQGADTFMVGQARWFARDGSASPIYIVCDNDDAGAGCGWLRYSTLRSVGVEPRRISVIAPPWDRRRLKDAHDAIEAGVSLSAFRQVNLARLEKKATAYRATRRHRYGLPTPTGEGRAS